MWKTKKIILGISSLLGISIVPFTFLFSNNMSKNLNVNKINRNDDTSNTSTTNIVSTYSTNLYIDQNTYQVTTTNSGNCFIFPTTLSLNLNVVGNQNVLVVNISSDSNNGLPKSIYDTQFTGSNLTSINNQFADCINTILSTVGNVTQDASGNSTGAFTNSAEMSGFRISNLNIGFSFTEDANNDGSGTITINNSNTTYDLTTDHDNYNNELGKNNELSKTNANQLQQINTLNNTQIGLIVVIVLFLLIIAILVFLMIRNKRRMKD